MSLDPLRNLAAMLVPLLFVTACGRQDAESNTLVKNSQIFIPPTNAVSTNSPEVAPTNQPAISDTPLVPLYPTRLELENALKLMDTGDYNGALAKADAVIKADPKNLSAYSLRGNIYGKLKNWDSAKKDFETILQTDVENSNAKFNLNELQFMQKDYTSARPGFAALASDPELGDLAAYKVFLCDLFSGEEVAAHNELEAFNRIATRPSYYFGNVAWSIHNKHPDEAKSWLDSAFRIYAPKKAYLYTFSLQDLGYLPIKPTSINPL